MERGFLSSLKSVSYENYSQILLACFVGLIFFTTVVERFCLWLSDAIRAFKTPLHNALQEKSGVIIAVSHDTTEECAAANPLVECTPPKANPPAACKPLPARRKLPPAARPLSAAIESAQAVCMPAPAPAAASASTVESSLAVVKLTPAPAARSPNAACKPPLARRKLAPEARPLSAAIESSQAVCMPAPAPAAASASTVESSLAVVKLTPAPAARPPRAAIESAQAGRKPVPAPAVAFASAAESSLVVVMHTPALAAVAAAESESSRAG
jgi:hypothetical protein